MFLSALSFWALFTNIQSTVLLYVYCNYQFVGTLLWSSQNKTSITLCESWHRHPINKEMILQLWLNIVNTCKDSQVVKVPSTVWLHFMKCNLKKRKKRERKTQQNKTRMATPATITYSGICKAFGFVELKHTSN